MVYHVKNTSVSTSSCVSVFRLFISEPLSNIRSSESLSNIHQCEEVHYRKSNGQYLMYKHSCMKKSQAKYTNDNHLFNSRKSFSMNTNLINIAIIMLCKNTTYTYFDHNETQLNNNNIHKNIVSFVTNIHSLKNCILITYLQMFNWTLFYN